MGSVLSGSPLGSVPASDLVTVITCIAVLATFMATCAVLSESYFGCLHFLLIVLCVSKLLFCFPWFIA